MHPYKIKFTISFFYLANAISDCNSILIICKMIYDAVAIALYISYIPKLYRDPSLLPILQNHCLFLLQCVRQLSCYHMEPILHNISVRIFADKIQRSEIKAVINQLLMTCHKDHEAITILTQLTRDFKTGHFRHIKVKKYSRKRLFTMAVKKALSFGKRFYFSLDRP